MTEERIIEAITGIFGKHEELDEERYEKLAERLGGIEQQLRVINGTVKATKAEIGPGYPSLDERDARRSTIRDRLHALENDREAARIAEHALTVARRSRMETWSRLQKGTLFLFVAIAAISSVLRVVGIEIAWHP